MIRCSRSDINCSTCSSSHNIICLISLVTIERFLPNVTAQPKANFPKENLVSQRVFSQRSTVAWEIYLMPAGCVVARPTERQSSLSSSAPGVGIHSTKSASYCPCGVQQHLCPVQGALKSRRFIFVLHQQVQPLLHHRPLCVAPSLLATAPGERWIIISRRIPSKMRGKIPFSSSCQMTILRWWELTSTREHVKMCFSMLFLLCC